MPPNTGSGTILEQFECSYKQAANPYSDKKHACFEECPDAGGSGGARERVAPETTVDDTMRVTTRARLTYELYNYSKNAMMIVTTRPDAYVRTGVVDLLKTAFENFRFEVDVGIASTRSELYNICDTFFQRDFTEYGAVGLVILTVMGVNRRQPGLKFEKRFFKESVILENFKVERNPTLANKPKIYITEARRGHCGAQELSPSQILKQDIHGDVISFHLPETYEAAVRRLCLDSKIDSADVLDGPLKIFCDNLSALGDNETLPKIIFKTFNDFFDKFSLDRPNAGTQNNSPVVEISRRKIEVVTTLTKELYFARTGDQ